MGLSWQKSQKSDPIKAFPRSVTILLGTPNRWVMSSMNFAASFDVTVATMRTSIHLVIYPLPPGCACSRQGPS
jgi:hypothetical protein